MTEIRKEHLHKCLEWAGYGKHACFFFFCFFMRDLILIVTSGEAKMMNFFVLTQS